MEGFKVSWWPKGCNHRFPIGGDGEVGVTQGFITNFFKKILSLNDKYNKTKFSEKAPHTLNLKSAPCIDAHSYFHIAKRKSDNVFTEVGKSGELAITLVGENKACLGGDREFPNSDIGQVVDVLTKLMNIQKFRPFCYSFLTDGRKFMFFKCARAAGGEYLFSHSSVYLGKNGWQVWFFAYISVE